MPMIALIALAAASVAMPPPKGNRERWLRAEDIPQSEFAAGNDGTFFFKALVAPDGKVEQCSVLGSTAPKPEWASFCEKVKRRFAYGAVTDHAGAPAYFVLEDNFAFVLPEQWVPSAAAMPADLVVEVASLPGAKGGKLAMPVNVAVDARGALLQCNAAVSSDQSTLARLACDQLKVQWKAMPEKNAAGQPVAYVRQLQVEFHTQKAG
jgi:hypothetical protein